ARRALAAVDGVEPLHEQPVVREFAVTLPVGSVADVERIAARCQEQGVNPGYALGHDYEEHPGGLLVALTEQRSRADIDRLAATLAAVLAEVREEVPA
ncbi:MAG TPA: glycine dehydrogenase, partial [Solirubrobacteraceae bacterium]|nr:glycine dehydrogenase [Solirubrobacteraceae bacterium]